MIAAPDTVSERNERTSNAPVGRPPLLAKAAPERRASSSTTRVLTADFASRPRSSRYS